MTLAILCAVGLGFSILFALSVAYGCGIYSIRSQVSGYVYGSRLSVKYLSEEETWTRATYVGVDLQGRILTQRKGEDQIRRVIFHKPYDPFENYDDPRRN